MNSFSEYMDKIKAEKELKTKTEAFVRTALLNAECREKIAGSGSEFRKEKFAFNKFLVAVSVIAACLVLALGGNAYYHMPVNYVCLDINPSVELGINAFGRVVSTQAYNEDGIQLFGDKNYSNWSVEDAISTLVQDAAKQGFIAEDGSTVIAVTAEAGNEKVASELQSSGEAGANSALNTDGISAIVYCDCTDLQLRKQAKEAGISPGKLRLILILQTFDPNITVEDYKNAKMTDIIAKADELISQSDNAWKIGNDAEILEQIRNAAEQVQKAYANAERERNRNGIENQSQSSGGEEQNRNQVQNQGSEPKQQIQKQSSDTGQQVQNPEERMQNQNQGGSTAAPSQNQEQTNGVQSDNGRSTQGDGNGDPIAPASKGSGAATGNSGSSSGAQSENKKGGKLSLDQY